MVKKQNIANSGEYYIGAILSAYDCSVSITLGRAERFDLLVVNLKGHPLKVQVKTRYNRLIMDFPLSEKAEYIKDDDLFYVFVRWNEFKTIPDYWVVPAEAVAEVVKSSHRIWLSIPGRKDQHRRDTKMREFAIIQKEHFPRNWETQLKGYYMNIRTILDF